MKQTKLVKALAGTTLGGALLMAGASAFAADTADLTVKGTVIPAACTPAFDGGGTVDLGTIQASSLKDTDYTTLNAKPVKLTVSCSAPIRIDIRALDNKSASSLGAAIMSAVGVMGAPHVYGLGTTTINGQSVSLGSYSLKFDGKATVDSATYTVNYAGVAESGKTYGNAASSIASDGLTIYSPVTTGNVAATGKVFVFPLTLTAAINKGSLLPLTGDVDLDGQATFTITYW
ncbi:DUF1120 domain-containing protein [Trinickia sp. YCB016]